MIYTSKQSHYSGYSIRYYIHERDKTVEKLYYIRCEWNVTITLFEQFERLLLMNTIETNWFHH